MSDELARDFLLKGFPNPERIGCPDENTLKELAEDRLPDSHPGKMHLASCSECYAEYLHFRADMKEGARRAHHSEASRGLSQIRTALPHRANAQPGSRTSLWPVAIAASVIVVIASAGISYTLRHKTIISKPQMAVSQPIDAFVDLFAAGTFRGAPDGPKPLEQVSLPAAVVQLSVTLPRFSQPGFYTIVISQDKTGDEVLVKAAGSGVDEQGKVKVRVLLDLRSARPGAYFLATVRGSDSGTYYYPLQIK